VGAACKFLGLVLLGHSSVKLVFETVPFIVNCSL